MSCGPTPDNVVCHNTDVTYRFQPMVSKSPMFKTDIHLAKPIDDTPEAREFLTAHFSLNSDVIVAEMLGVVRMATSAQTEIGDGKGRFRGQEQAENRGVCTRISPGAPPALGLPGARKRPEQVWPDASGGGRDDRTPDLRTRQNT